MFKTGEFVLKNGFGVLEIVEVLTECFMPSALPVEYYKLVSLDKKTVVNVPVVGAGELISPVLTKKQAKNILDDILQFAVSLDPNEKARRKFLESKLNGGRRECLVVVGSVLKRVADGKKLAYFEKSALDIAGDKVFSEIAFVLGISKEEAKNKAMAWA